MCRHREDAKSDFVDPFLLPTEPTLRFFSHRLTTGTDLELKVAEGVATKLERRRLIVFGTTQTAQLLSHLLFDFGQNSVLDGTAEVV